MTPKLSDRSEVYAALRKAAEREQEARRSQLKVAADAEFDKPVTSHRPRSRNRRKKALFEMHGVRHVRISSRGDVTGTKYSTSYGLEVATVLAGCTAGKPEERPRAPEPVRDHRVGIEAERPQP